MVAGNAAAPASGGSCGRGGGTCIAADDGALGMLTMDQKDGTGDGEGGEMTWVMGMPIEGCAGWRGCWHGRRDCGKGRHDRQCGGQLRNDRAQGRKLGEAPVARKAILHKQRCRGRGTPLDGRHSRGEVPHLPLQPVDGGGQCIEGVVGMAVSGGGGSGAVNTMAALVTVGGGMVVVGAVVGTAAAEVPELDMADTRLLECRLPRR